MTEQLGSDDGRRAQSRRALAAIAFRYGGFPGLDVAHLPLAQIGLNDRVAFKQVTGSWGDAADRLVARLRRDVLDL